MLGELDRLTKIRRGKLNRLKLERNKISLRIKRRNQIGNICHRIQYNDIVSSEIILLTLYLKYVVECLCATAM